MIQSVQKEFRMALDSHYHACPKCYIYEPCSMSCTVDPELEGNGNSYGSHCLCEECEKEKAEEDKYQSKEFWDRYNGFIK